MPAKKSGFLDKLLGRIDRVTPKELEGFLLRVIREKGFLEQVFNALQEGILVVDREGKIQFLNSAACGFFGLTPEECIGKRLSEKVRGLDWDAFMAADRTVSRDMEVFYPQNRFINFYAVPLDAGEIPEDSGGKDEVGGATALILRDITETRKTTQETIESERLSALTLLAAGVAHELGNPLNSLNIHLQLLERKARRLPEGARVDFEEYLRVAREEIQRLDSIINQFLRAIRPTAPDLRPCALNDLVRESVTFLAGEIQDRDILVETELHSGLPMMEIDRDQMKQAFFNIIRNAFQAMKTGGLLRIRTDRDDTHAMIEFADTGGGISPGDMGKIFNPYFTTKSSGSGLGLLIVRRIVREHAGEIAIASNEGKGVTFTIRLPLKEQRVRLLEAGQGRPGGRSPRAK